MEGVFAELDANMIVPPIPELAISDLAWHDAGTLPFRLEGFPWFAKERTFRRLPRDREEKLSKAVDQLAYCTAGGGVKFKTDSPKILLRVELTNPAGRMYHMAATGESGFDLYQGEPGRQRYVKTSMFHLGVQEYTAILLDLAVSQGIQEYTINFPLYNGVKKLEIGLLSEAVLVPPSQCRGSRIVVYGGSTMQGACASRPGRSVLNIIAGKLNREVVNLGFSGNGKMELAMAEVISEIPEMGVLMIEAERNTGYENLKERLVPFLNKVRERYPELPIVLWSANPYSYEYFQEESRERRLRNLEFMRSTIAASDDPNLRLFDGSDILGEDYYECSVDGLHPTDLGFARMADALIPFLRNMQ